MAIHGILAAPFEFIHLKIKIQFKNNNNNIVGFFYCFFSFSNSLAGRY